MSTIYQWQINQLDTKPKEGELLNVVVCVNWTRTATKYVGAEPILVSVYGAMSCSTPSATDFTAYPDLTYDQVCSWLDAGLDVAELDLNLDAQIENIINPPVVTLPLPWANPIV